MLRKDPPELLFLNNAKPVIYGAMAARLSGVKRTVAMVGGLGYAFIEDDEASSFSKKIARWAASFLYGISLRLVRAVIFHNSDDLALLVERGICPSRIAHVIPGSGVDLKHYRPSMRAPSSAQVFIFVGRLLAEKGIREFIEAARIVKAKYPKSRFLIVGGPASNPSSIGEAEIRELAREGVVEWVGHVGDVRPYLHASTVFVLPSYREGLPRSALEAMACGLPVITTDVPGCRNVVQNGVNGALVPARSAAAVADAMERFCESPGIAEKMGLEGRKCAEKHYSVQSVNRLVIEILDGI
jgi:glycosyltransferase involved in cell wall biosynthesis